MTDVTQMTHDEHHRALVRRLAAEVKPTRRLWTVAVRLGLWMALEVGVLTWVATHTSNDFMQKLKQPAYVIEVVFFIAAAVISAGSGTSCPLRLMLSRILASTRERVSRADQTCRVAMVSSTAAVTTEPGSASIIRCSRGLRGMSAISQKPPARIA